MTIIFISVYFLTGDGLPKARTISTRGKGIVPFSIANRNVELVHECSPEYLRMGRARMK